MLLISVSIYNNATGPKEINYLFSGIKYNTKDTSQFEPVEVYIYGNLKSSFFGKPNEFLGKIKIGDVEYNYSDSPIKFSKDNFADFKSGKESGMLYIDKMFARFTLDIFKRNTDGSYSSSGWMISAPSQSVTEAIEINTELIPDWIRKFLF